jgi:transposase
LFPKLTDWPAFKERVSVICETIKKAIAVHQTACKTQPASALEVISLDEKTGIQALERHQQRAALSQGGGLRTEVEYIRHGTTCLMGALAVGSGKLIHERIHPSRTEADTTLFMKGLLAKLPLQGEVVLLADQLNTHLSEGVVRVIAQHIGYEGDLGQKGKYGILHNKQSRQLFLEDPSHRIRFLFTPRHCSWLNPIENWFSKLQRGVLSKASVESVEELSQKLRHYIRYYNESLFKPVKWTFSGFKKDKELNNIIMSKT